MMNAGSLARRVIVVAGAACVPLTACSPFSSDDDGPAGAADAAGGADGGSGADGGGGDGATLEGGAATTSVQCGSATCATGQRCCMGTSDMCVPREQPCDGITPLELTCDDATDCSLGYACCVGADRRSVCSPGACPGGTIELCDMQTADRQCATCALYSCKKLARSVQFEACTSPSSVLSDLSCTKQ